MGGCASANTSGLAVSFALDERCLETLRRYKIAKSGYWDRILGYSSAQAAERQHSIYAPLARRKSLGRQGLHSECATTRRRGTRQNESTQKKNPQQGNNPRRINHELRTCFGCRDSATGPQPDVLLTSLRRADENASLGIAFGRYAAAERSRSPRDRANSSAR